MQTELIIKGGFIVSKLQNKKQIQDALKEVENYNKQAKNYCKFFSR